MSGCQCECQCCTGWDRSAAAESAEANVRALIAKLEVGVAAKEARIRAEEREACAKIAEACEPGAWSAQWQGAQRAIATAIRARGGKP